MTAGYAALLRPAEDLTGGGRTLVPVSAAHQQCGRARHRVSLMLLELPVGVADHLDRLRHQGRMTELKASHMVEVGEPPPLWATLPRRW